MRLETYSGDKPYIFVSYAHKDAEAVLPVIEALQKQGFRIWFDQGIEAGTEWPEFIAEHLDTADKVIVFMSNAAAESKNCRREINYAIDINKEPLVVYLEEVKLSSGLKLQLNTLQAMFKYHAKTDEDFIVELSKAKMLQSCREGQPAVQTAKPEEVSQPTEQPAPQPVPAPTETSPEPQPAPVSVTEEPTDIPKAAPPAETPIPAPEPVSEPTVDEGVKREEPKKKGLGKKAIIAICCVAVLVIGFAAIAIGYLSNLEEELKVTKLETVIDSDTRCELELSYRESDNIVAEMKMTFRYRVDYEITNLLEKAEIEEQVEEMRQELREEVKDMLFASTYAGYEIDGVYAEYRFNYLDQNHYAQQLVDDFFEVKEYSPHYDEGDYRIYYPTILAELQNEGFSVVKK